MNFLDISGVPGLGKTACLMEVIRELQEKKTEFSFHYLNGLKLQKPENLYSKLVHEQIGKSKNPFDACKNLEYIFRNGKFPNELNVRYFFRI